MRLIAYPMFSILKTNVRPHCLTCCSKGTQRHNDILRSIVKRCNDDTHNLPQSTTTNEGQCYPHWIHSENKKRSRERLNIQRIGLFKLVLGFHLLYIRNLETGKFTHRTFLYRKTKSFFVTTHPKKGQ